MLPRVKQVIQQTKARILGGDTHAVGKLFSIFEESTEVIRKGKAGKPNEFGKMVKVQEVENQVVTHFEVYDLRPADSDLLIPAIEMHERRTSRTPDPAAGDAGFYSAKHVAEAQQMGVKRVPFRVAPAKAPHSSVSRRSVGLRKVKSGEASGLRTRRRGAYSSCFMRPLPLAEGMGAS